MQREADRARRLIGGLNDPRSVRALSEYASELDGLIRKARVNPQSGMAANS